MPDLKNPAVIALLFGLAVGVLLGLWITNRFVHRAGPGGGRPLLVVRAAWAMVVVGALPSLLCAYIVGGNLGLMANAATLNTPAGEWVATASGIALVLAACVLACGAIGAVVGALFAPTGRRGDSSLAPRRDQPASRAAAGNEVASV